MGIIIKVLNPHNLHFLLSKAKLIKYKQSRTGPE